MGGVAISTTSEMFHNQYKYVNSSFALLTYVFESFLWCLFSDGLSAQNEVLG